MSALRQRLKRPGTYLAGVAVLFALAAIDATRQPAEQVTARVYVSAVDGYQQYLRPAASRVFQCRYRPTCSEYSRQAVVRHGIFAGLRLTWNRMVSCRAEVAMGTVDAVPEAVTK